MTPNTIIFWEKFVFVPWSTENKLKNKFEPLLFLFFSNNGFWLAFGKLAGRIKKHIKSGEVALLEDPSLNPPGARVLFSSKYLIVALSGPSSESGGL